MLSVNVLSGYFHNFFEGNKNNRQRINQTSGDTSCITSDRDPDPSVRLCVRLIVCLSVCLSEDLLLYVILEGLLAGDPSTMTGPPIGDRWTVRTVPGFHCTWFCEH